MTQPPRESDDPTLFHLLDPSKQDFEFSAKPREVSSERSSRLRLREARALHDRRRHAAILVAFPAGLSLSWVIFVAILFAPGASPEMREWARTGVATILAGAVGYLARGG